MSRFVVKSRSSGEESYFDRQERISWWDQRRLREARIMVVGAGAIGNEVLKNLALLGVGYLFLVDFDTISPSNLSRTVLFRPQDVGKKKAEVAAERIRDLCLEPSARIDWFHGDLVWELGTRVFGSMDVILGCVDNVEARLTINRQCWLTKVPWIDAGIHELAGHVSVFVPPDSSCYECAVTPQQLAAAQRRYSCDAFKRRVAEEGRAPTVQVSSALVAALQAQEAVKLICGHPVAAGKTLLTQGTINDFDTITVQRKESCYAHASYPEVREIDVSTARSLRSLLQEISSPELAGPGAILDLSTDRAFVLRIRCKVCTKWIDLNVPQFRAYDSDTICPACSALGKSAPDLDGQPAEKEVLQRFSLAETPDSILEFSLEQIGIPPLHVLPVLRTDGSYQYFGMTGDLARLLPHLKAQAPQRGSIDRP